MLYTGKAIQVQEKEGILYCHFNIVDGSANVIGKLMMDDMVESIPIIQKQNAKGMLLVSDKDHFIFGADITEFKGHFHQSENEIAAWLGKMNVVLNQLEDLPFPTVACINGHALGGGFEVCLATDFRLAAVDAKLGLPETQLGIMPGWGGSVRLPRISGADHAIEWISSGKQWNAKQALDIGIVDGVVENSKLIQAGLRVLDRASKGELDWKKRRSVKQSPLKLDKIESMMAFETAKAYIAGMSKHYPAPLAAVKVMQETSTLQRDEALKREAKVFAELAKTSVAESLVEVFLGDQYLKKISKKMTKNVGKVQKAAVLGAGIMGGGIAYQSASKGTPIVMKDINDKALDLGLTEASKLLGKQMQYGKIDAIKMAKTLNMIDPTLHYGDLKDVELVVEAVVENIKIKKAVLAETESQLDTSAVLASNTSTISITELAKDLKRPENFCGMHFFNPVHKMPLVEVIRGEKSSDATIAKTVAYALQMGKTPIVVKDCPGFLVNRVLFPYFNAFSKLIEDGVDYKRIDRIMENFGWPMGPAYLMDVVGIDTGSHATKILGDAFPDRMKNNAETIIDIMFKENRLGQKNGLGFYKYEIDKKGKPNKVVDPNVEALIKKAVKRQIDISDEDIVLRMMIPMIIECARCLEEKIVATAQEVDMGLLLGIGFPPFRAGALKYASSFGMQNLYAKAKSFESIGNMYKFTETMQKMANSNTGFYQE